MAFTPDTFAASVDTIGGGSIRAFFYRTPDWLDDVTVADYFVDVRRHGAREGDIVVVIDDTTDLGTLCSFVTIDANGNGTVETNEIEQTTISIKRFGAKGDGETDDTAAFQRAADSGHLISGVPGRFILSERIDWTAGGLIGGPDFVLVPDINAFDNTSTSVVPRYGANAVVLAVQGGLEAPWTPLDSIIFRGFTIDFGKGVPGQADGGLYVQAIVARNIDHIDISGLEIKNWTGGSAITIASVLGGKVNDNYIHDFYTNTPLHYGLLIHVDNDPLNGVFSTDLDISFNRLARNLYGQTAFESDTTYQPDGIDILGLSTKNIRLIGNSIKRMGKGITSFGTDIIIAGNKFEKLFNYGVALEHGAKDTVVSGNGLLDIGAAGIILVAQNGSDCSGNIVIGNKIKNVGVDAWVAYAAGYWVDQSTDTAGILTWPDIGSGSVVDNLLVDNSVDPGEFGVFSFARFSSSTNYWINNKGIAGTTSEYNAGSAELGPVVGPGSAAQLTGTTTNDLAIAGNLGELLISTVAASAPVDLSDNVVANITSLVLTPGEWDLTASGGLLVGASTVLTQLAFSFGPTSATLDQDAAHAVARNYPAGFVPGNTVNEQMSLPIFQVRVVAATLQTYYLVAYARFTTSTAKAFGQIRARRVR